MLVGFADTVIVVECLLHQDVFNAYARYVCFVVLQFCVLLLLVCLIQAACTNPGSTPKIYIDTEIDDFRYCEICDRLKPPRTHHCRKCNMCIHRMDHHCIWIGNCVGYNNHKYFLLLLFYVTCCCMIGFGIIIYLLIYDIFIKRIFEGNILSLILTSIAGFECLGFGVFTSIFLFEQIYILSHNQSTIEKANRKYGKDQGKLENLSLVLGSNKLYWFLPVKPKLKVDFTETLINYSELLLNKQNESRRTQILPES